jgi:uncharacterized protein
MTGEKLIPLIVERIIEESPDKIILFGSYAYGIPDENSDIDILVVTGDEMMPADYNEKSRIYLKLARKIFSIQKQFPIDLIVHTRPMHEMFIKLDSMFAREIAMKGKVLYEKNNE